MEMEMERERGPEMESEMKPFNPVSLAAPKYDKLQNAEPMPSKKQLLKRKSFGSVNENPYLDKLFGVCK